jgi:[ribosomal protein S5]-alanine N-acetyltransferase
MPPPVKSPRSTVGAHFDVDDFAIGGKTGVWRWAGLKSMCFARGDTLKTGRSGIERAWHVGGAMRGTILHTERLLLRPFRDDDVDGALSYRNDAEFARYLPHIPQPFTRADAIRFVTTNMDELWETSPTFAIELDGRLIGTVNLEVDAANQIAMLGYAIARDHWGKGIALEAARAVVSWGFEALSLAKIWASTDARHQGSRRIMEKLGMTREGTLRAQHRDRDGSRADEVIYGLLREEWAATANPPSAGTF